MQTIIVIAIVAAAVVFIARRAWLSFSRSRATSDGCANCDVPTHAADDWAK